MKDLAICIPAYNRIGCLLDLLKTVVNQINSSNNKNIQVCISDDCSPNNLEVPIKTFMENHNVEYIYWRNETNLGADKNFLKSVEISNARYCWLLGDDDGIPDGKIDLILQYINNYPDINVFFGNRYICNRKLQIRLKEKWTKNKNDFFVDFTNKEKIIEYFDQLNSTTCLGYLSTLIVKKESWNQIKKDEYEPFIGTIYIQVAMYLLMLYKKDKLFRITDYIALSRFGYDNFFYSLKQRIFMDYYGFLRVSTIFANDKEIYDSFIGIIRRHYNNIFLYAMSYTAELKSSEIEILRKICYSEKQINIFTNRNKTKAFFGFIFSVIKSIFIDFYWFYKTIFVIFQKLLGNSKGEK